MAAITAALVKELREKTGAGMMDCKTALNETNGDIESAVDWLRKKGLSKAAKKAGRVAAEGLIAIHVDGNVASIAEVNSETDFVARNDQFQDFVKDVVQIAAKQGETSVEAIENSANPKGAGTIKDRLQELIATIGENMTLRRADSVKISQGVIGSYLHSSIGDGFGKIGVLALIESEGNPEDIAPVARQIAMHIAATNPVSIDSEGVSPSIIEREKAILADKNAGKPANVLEKIIDNGLKSYFKEVCLLEQPFVHDSSKSVTQVLKELETKVGKSVKLVKFVRFGLGEGIEKEEAMDFAAEVAATVGNK